MAFVLVSGFGLTDRAANNALRLGDAVEGSLFSTSAVFNPIFEGKMKLMRIFSSVLATALCFLAVESARAQDAADLALQMGPKLADAIKSQLSSRKNPQIAVMPFSNNKGIVDPTFADTIKALQGELETQLRSGKAGLVLPGRAIDKGFTTAGLSPTALDIADPTGTGAHLATLKWDAVVMGQFDSTGPAALAASTTNDLKWNVTIIFQNGDVSQHDFGSPKACVPPPSTMAPSGRFNVEILVDDNVLPFLTDPHDDSMYHNVKFLQIDPSMVGKEYQIRLTDNGTPEAGFESSRVPETERVFGAAVLIDGVDSFARETGRMNPTTGKPEVDFAQVHAKNAFRWLLTSPGKKIVPDPSQPEGFVLADFPLGDDHSTRTISGYQMGAETAAAFTFAQSGSGELTAELLGVTEDIGMIQVSFYPRKLDGDRMLPSHRNNTAGLGTKPGRELKHGVQQVSPKFHSDPVEIWRIFYRTADAFPVPSSSLVPFAGTSIPPG